MTTSFTPAPPGPPASQATTSRRTLLLAAITLMIVGLLVGWLLGPQHQQLSNATAGDQALADRTRAVLDNDNGLRGQVVAEITPEGSRWAGIGSAGADLGGPAPTDQTPFELGSITKTFTASLYQQAIDKGEVNPQDKLSQHLPELAGTPAGGATLESLSQHTSGLPSLTTQTAAESLLPQITNENFYGPATMERELARAGTTPLSNPGQYGYSNLGVALLGHAMARAADAPDWSTLARQRVLDPMGMTSTTFAATEEQIPADAAVGHLYNGVRAPRWVGEFYLPAGTSTFITAADLARWGEALLAGTAPGAAAMEPVIDIEEGTKIGRIWTTTTGQGQTYTWHNGGTGGFRTQLMLDREDGRGYLILSNTTRWVDTQAVRLINSQGDQLAEVPPTAGENPMAGWISYGIAALLMLSSLWTAFRAKHRLSLIGGLLIAVGALALGWVAGPWDVVGGWVYGFLLGGVIIAVAQSVRRWPTVPVRPKKWLVPAIGSLIFSAVVMVALFFLF
ncbi:MAG: beta-lactamase family protein [Propionibacteriales bacterium]|nr:beta-lactamase family protein [Propionibacteriales bacterium]